MIKVLFVCHGNICRSAMAKFIFKDMVLQKGLSTKFLIDSAAVSYEEEGNDMYPPAKDVLKKHGVFFEHHIAHCMQKTDYNKFDYIICMDESNVYNIMKIIGTDSLHKVYCLLDFSSNPRDIDDPWYTGNFEKAYQDITEGLESFLKFLNF